MKNKGKINKISLDFKTLRNLQLKSLEMLLYFKKICDDHKLLFYFCGGCCIGAIRHGGFIPWDDDIDVFMPRDDYEKLFKIWQNYADTQKYSCLKTTKNQFAGNIFTTIVDNNTTLIRPNQIGLDIPKGIVIDVFPLDGCPENSVSKKFQMFWALIYSLYCSQIVPKNHGKLTKFLGSLLLKIIPGENLKYKIWRFAEKQMIKHKISDCTHIKELCAGPNYMKNEYPKEIFESAEYKNFEGYLLPIPVGSDKYLRIAFGDYLKLPKKEEQIPQHDIVFLDLEDSYKKYEQIFGGKQ